MSLSIKPSSILQLTITGFLVVTGLLISALIVTAEQLDGVTDRSQRVISQSATAMRASRILIEQITAMERNIRQYRITGDAEILKIYANRRITFAEVAAQMAGLKLADEITGYVDSLLSNEQHAFESVTTLPGNPDIEALYPQMLNIAYEISRATDEWTDNELANIRRESEEAQTMLTVQTLALVSAALVLAAIFTVLITRPLIQVTRAINQLGRGAYETPVKIRGPQDLVNLGERLEWLRGRLTKLEQQRTSFLRHVSHELKTPLAAIQESSALLSEGLVGDLTPDQNEIIRIQSSNCHRLSTIIENLLRHNSDSFSVLNAMPQALRFDKIIDGVVTTHEPDLRSRQLRIEYELEKITVMGEAEQLRVIVDNLLSNAIRFSPNGGMIKLWLRQEGQDVVFEILDQGPGIKPEEAEKIFEAFYKGEVDEKDFYKGSGLGLAIAEEYAKANGGALVALTSGKGGHFRLTLLDNPKEA
ncbi:MAG: HAMP domain-containing sensor histidine kinase [Pseudomonadota bacterium]